MKILHGILFSCMMISVNAQRAEKVLNLPQYENEPVHFGFSLMVNRSILVPDQGSSLNGYQFVPVSGSGFGIGIISEYAINRHFTLRFIPDLSFLDRSLEYRQVGSGNAPVVSQGIESTVIHLPVNLKIKTSRIDNFALFMIGGARYSIDLTKNPSFSAVALKRYDVACDAGLGMDVYMNYFKCGVELKFIKGITDLMIHNPGPSSSVNSIKSQCLVLSLNFEG
jgi:hypothetical protein